MSASRLLAAALVAAGVASAAAAQGTGPAAPHARPAAAPRAPAAKPAPAAPRFASEDELYADAARVAWHYVEPNLQPTGFVNALRTYPYATVWDLGSGLAALYCAHELGLVTDARYDARMRQALHSLRTIGLFDGAAFNKFYATATGTMMSRAHAPSRRGYGWSATDIGRLLVWLKIIAAAQPAYASDAAAVAARLVPARVVKGGYIRGAGLEANGTLREYQEGRLGYEQYAAQGFALWGLDAERARDLRRNGIPTQVMGQTILADKRGNDRLTSEPFVLAGLELGWDPDTRALAEALLAAQAERARRTGRLTATSEDAVSRPPFYFYYYCVYTHGREFAPDSQDSHAALDEPRWVSTKAAFGWNALLPSDYTRRLVAAVAPARGADGWASGVFEGTARSTRSANVNTAAVVLEAALYRKRGAPLLKAAP